MKAYELLCFMDVSLIFRKETLLHCFYAFGFTTIRVLLRSSKWTSTEPCLVLIWGLASLQSTRPKVLHAKGLKWVSCRYSSGSQPGLVLPRSSIWLCQETYLVVTTGCGVELLACRGGQGHCRTSYVHRTAYRLRTTRPHLSALLLGTLLYRIPSPLVCRARLCPCLSGLRTCRYEFFSIPFS